MLPSKAPCTKHAMPVKRNDEGKRMRQGTILAASREVSIFVVCLCNDLIFLPSTSNLGAMGGFWPNR